MLTPGACSTPIAYKRALRADPCSYCGGQGGITDHIVPRVLGGGDDENLTGACQGCNSRKSSKRLLSFLAHRRGWTPDREAQVQRERWLDVGLPIPREGFPSHD